LKGKRKHFGEKKKKEWHGHLPYCHGREKGGGKAALLSLPEGKSKESEKKKRGGLLFNLKEKREGSTLRGGKDTKTGGN